MIERASVDEAYLDITELVNKEISQSQLSVTEMMEKLPNTFVIGYSTPGNNDEGFRNFNKELKERIHFEKYMDFNRSIMFLAHRREAVENWLGTTYGELGDIQSRRLAVAGAIVEQIRTDIYEITGYRCSAGISYNKVRSEYFISFQSIQFSQLYFLNNLFAFVIADLSQARLRAT